MSEFDRKTQGDIDRAFLEELAGASEDFMTREIYAERIRRILTEPSPWTDDQVKELCEDLDRQAEHPETRSLAELGIPETTGWEPAQVASARAVWTTLRACASMAPDFPLLFAEAEMEPEKREVDGYLATIPTGRVHCYVKVPRWFFRVLEKGVLYYARWYRWRHPLRFRKDAFELAMDPVNLESEADHVRVDSP